MIATPPDTSTQLTALQAEALQACIDIANGGLDPCNADIAAALSRDEIATGHALNGLERKGYIETVMSTRGPA